jgi:hypothetical protein
MHIYIPIAPRYTYDQARSFAEILSLLADSNNPDLFDFSPSPYSHRYFGAAELAHMLEASGFAVSIAGYARTSGLPLRHRVLRPLKAAADRFGLVPRTMRGKQVLRRLIYGRLPEMPSDLGQVSLPYVPPTPIRADAPEREHRFLYARGERVG